MADKSDGEVLDANEVNSHKIHRKVYNDDTERSHTGDTDWTDSGTSFTLTNGLNALILAIYVDWELKAVGAVGRYNLKMSGTNLGNKYIGARIWTTGEVLPALEDSEPIFASKADAASYAVYHAHLTPLLKLLDETTTFKIRFKIDLGTETVYVKNITVTVVYVDGFTED